MNLLYGFYDDFYEYKQVKLTASPSSSQSEMPYLWQYICVEPAGNNQAIIERSISQRIF